MPGQPRSRARKAEEAREALALAAATSEERERELAELTHEGFDGHRPPKPPPLDALPPVEEILDALEPEEREVLLHELWPSAVDAIQAVLDDADASASAKVQAARLVSDMKKRQMDEEASKLPTRIIFETAAYMPPPPE